MLMLRDVLLLVGIALHRCYVLFHIYKLVFVFPKEKCITLMAFCCVIHFGVVMMRVLPLRFAKWTVLFFNRESVALLVKILKRLLKYLN